MRVARDCSVRIRGKIFPSGADLTEAHLLKVLEEVPPLEVRLRGMPEAEFVEITDTAPGRYAIREVAPETYANPGRAASFTVDSTGALVPQYKEQPPDDGTKRFQELLGAPETASPRVRRNGFFTGTPTAGYTPVEE